MIRILAATALAAFLSIAPAAAAERRYTVTDFDRIVVEGPYLVTLTTGRGPSAVASGPLDALDRLTLDVKGRTLRIRTDRTATSLAPQRAGSGGPVTLAVTGHELRSARLAGAGSLSIDRFAGQRIDLTLEGNGRVAVANASADMLVLTALGSGRIEIAGRVKEVRANVEGEAQLNGASLRTDRVRLVTDTSGRVALAADDEADVTASGVGEVDIGGNPACTVRGASAGSVRCGRGR